MEKIIQLSIELVPTTCWFSNLRSELTTKDWDFLKSKTFSAAHHRCELCGGRGHKWPVECHEIWKYNDEKKIQSLFRLVALCPKCHEVKHFGLAEVRGRRAQALQHLCKINNWTIEKAEQYIQQQFQKWAERSEHIWTLDISWLDKYNISPKQQPPR